MHLAQRLPVLPVPEQLLSCLNAGNIAGEQCLFEFVGNDMVNHTGGYGPPLLLTHHTQRVIIQEVEAGSVPLAAVYPRFFLLHQLFQAGNKASRQARRRSFLGWLSGCRSTVSPSA